MQIAENAIKYARQNSFNVVIVDTAGRLAVDEAMMQEITAIKAAVKPSETLFVVDAMTGQDAVNTAKEFNDRLDFDGVVLTKKRYLIPLDGSDHLTIELDVFEGRYAGLILAEVEFTSEEEAMAFQAPEWFGRDVTFTREYQNSRLACGK